MFFDTKTDFSKRDRAIRINSYTTVKRRTGVPVEIYDAYWRDVHGPLCARLPGLGWYVQHHFTRAHDSHLWPAPPGVTVIADDLLDGMVEIGFASLADQMRFKAASPLLFSDEQNIFDETVAYNLPQGSETLVDRFADPVPNGAVSCDLLHLHLHSASPERKAFVAHVQEYAEALADLRDIVKVRLHLPEPHDNAHADPPAPRVQHSVSPARTQLAMIEVAFPDPLTRRTLQSTEHFKTLQEELGVVVSKFAVFRVSGVYTFIRGGDLTTAGLRGSRAAELIRELGATNQLQPEVIKLLRSDVL